MERKGELHAGSVRFPGSVERCGLLYAIAIPPTSVGAKPGTGPRNSRRLSSMRSCPRLKLVHHEFRSDGPRSEHLGLAEVAEFAMLTMP